MKPLSPSAQKVQDTLSALGETSSVTEFEESTRTAQEAADRVGCQLGQIVKTLVFKTVETGRGLLVLTSGVNRVDEGVIGQVMGEDIVRPDADFVRSLTGFSIGGVPPVGHPQPILTLVDEDLLKYPDVWAAAGTPKAVFKIASTDLVHITRGKVLPVKQK